MKTFVECLTEEKKLLWNEAMNLVNCKGTKVHGWQCHKSGFDDFGRLNLLEQYIYLPSILLPKLMRFLNTKIFNWTEDARLFPRNFNIQMALEGKLHTGKGKPRTVVTDHEHYTHFSRPLLFRRQPYLVRIYECDSNPNGAIKLEVKYLNEQKGLRNPHHKLSAMREIKQRINKRFPIQDNWIFEDHSNGIPVNMFVQKLIRQAKQKTPDVHERMMRYIEERGGTEKISDLF